ncbi:MAG TPA: arsenate reductase ArsC [Gaiellaceae bacterium]|nr:arsenate reductase ArsC [Gaiellaceae bacterium]
MANDLVAFGDHIGDLHVEVREGLPKGTDPPSRGRSYLAGCNVVQRPEIIPVHRFHQPPDYAVGPIVGASLGGFAYQLVRGDGLGGSTIPKEAPDGRVLFVCLHNAGRSQMSEALFTEAAKGRHQAESGGTTPAERVHPQVVEVMGEKGIDLEGRRSRRLDRAAAERADVVVTMGCGDECPYIPGKRYIDWDLDDPKDKPVEDVRAVRDDIELASPTLSANSIPGRATASPELLTG